MFADRANVTVGGLYFTNDMDYHERRDLVGLDGNGAPAAKGPGVTQAASFDGGGEYEVDTYNVFAQVDYDLTDQWTLTAGVNWSYEEKDAKIASLSANINNPYDPAASCNIVEGPACPFDFEDDEDWDNIAPKLGATYNIDDNSSCGFTQTGDQQGTNALLDTLADNGGLTLTHSLHTSPSLSPAIDAGDNTACAASPINNVDQRGETRPADGDGDLTATCDVGAYEYIP